MPESFSQLKREELEKRLADLKEEYKAASAQWSRTRDEAERLRITRQMDALEEAIKNSERELKTLDDSSLQRGAADPCLEETPDQSEADLQSIPSPPNPREPSKEALARYGKWAEERLLRAIRESPNGTGQDLHQMAQVLCWQLRQKQADKMRHLERLKLRRDEAEQRKSVTMQAILNDIRNTDRELQRLEGLIQQASQLCDDGK